LDTVIVAGDGAVGIAAAVALSNSRRVILAGPPGTRTGMDRFSVEGAGEAELLHTGIDALEVRGGVVTALKAYSIRKAAPSISRILRGRVVCLSNGMGLQEEWGDIAPLVEYAVLTAGFRKTSETSVSMTPGELYCSEGGMTEALFTDTFISAAPVNDIETMRWAKWYANSIINPLGALSGLPNNMICSSPMAGYIDPLKRELARMMPSEEALEKGEEMLAWLLRHSSNRCSMLQDLESGNGTEIDFLTGYAVKELRGRCPAAMRIMEMVRSRT